MSGWMEPGLSRSILSRATQDSAAVAATPGAARKRKRGEGCKGGGKGDSKVAKKAAKKTAKKEKKRLKKGKKRAKKRTNAPGSLWRPLRKRPTRGQI